MQCVDERCCLAGCRRERNKGHASRSASAYVVYGIGRSTGKERGRRQNRDGDGAQWSGRRSPHYAQDKVWKRLRLNAKQTRHHSPAAAEIPRKENWRKPSISLMMPITGSTVHLRAP